MSADIIAWLESPEGEAWSREQFAYHPGAGLAPIYQTGPGEPGEDPTGRPPVKGPALIAAREEVA